MKALRRVLAVCGVFGGFGALGMAGCTGPQTTSGGPVGPAEPVTIRVVATTDVHGYYASRTNAEGRIEGGLRALATYVARQRQAGHNVLMLDGGDMWSGTLLSDGDEGQTGVSAFAVLGLDAAALGNHEFDYGPAGAARQSEEDPFGALRERAKQAPFPILAANVLDRASGKPPVWVQPTHMVERAGVRVGLIGLITEETPDITFPYVGERLQFTSAKEAVERHAPRLRQAGAHLVLVVAHLGGRCRAFSDPLDLSSCHPRSEAFDLLGALPPGTIDGYVGGHTHHPVAHVVAGVPMVQSGRYATQVAVMDLTVARAEPGSDRPKVTGEIVGLSPLDDVDKGLPLVRRIDQVLSPREAATKAQRDAPLGVEVTTTLDRSQHGGSPMGAFICDALSLVRPEADLCLVNAGGLRRDLAVGPLSYGALYDVLPFGNSLAELRLTGAQLKEMLRVGTSGAHGNLQTRGLKVVFEPMRDICPSVDRNGDGHVGILDRDRVVSAAMADGTPIEDGRTYTVVTNSFLARGGDGLTASFKGLAPDAVRVFDEQPPLREQIAALLRHRGGRVPSAGLGSDWQGRMEALGPQPPPAMCAPAGH